MAVTNELLLEQMEAMRAEIAALTSQNRELRDRLTERIPTWNQGSSTAFGRPGSRSCQRNGEPLPHAWPFSGFHHAWYTASTASTASYRAPNRALLCQDVESVSIACAIFTCPRTSLSVSLAACAMRCVFHSNRLA